MLPQPFEVIWQPWRGDYEAMVERRMIRVVMPYGGYQFYYHNGRPRGATYELVRRFESFVNDELSRKHIRVHVVIIPVSRDQLIPAILSGNADLIAADLTITAARNRVLDFSRPTLQNINEIVVTGPAAPELNEISDLAGTEIFVRRSGSYYEHLNKLSNEFRKQGLAPPIVQPANEILEAEDIMEMLDGGMIGISVMDDYKATFWASVFPEVSARKDLVVNEGGSIAWAMRKNSPELKAVVNRFHTEYGQGTLVGNDTFNRHMANANRIRCGTSSASYAEIADLAAIFQRYGSDYDFDWLMLAAQGLQESGLRQNRRSPAGAVGIMQIKPSTAADRNVGIDDISTAENNVHAGTKYMRFIVDRYFSSEEIDGLNQWFFALAAYNAGPARVAQMRREAGQKGYDPNLWFDNVEIIAAQRIGRETVTYVSNILKYYVGYQLVASRSAVREEQFGDILTGCSAPQ